MIASHHDFDNDDDDDVHLVTMVTVILMFKEEHGKGKKIEMTLINTLIRSCNGNLLLTAGS